jgi:hypothetical protein
MLIRYFTAAATLLLLCTAPFAQAQTAASTQPSEAAAMQAMTPAQKAKLAPRRQTEQVVGTPLPTVTDGYRPTLTSPPSNASGAPAPVGTLPVHPTPAGAPDALPASPMRRCRCRSMAVPPAIVPAPTASATTPVRLAPRSTRPDASAEKSAIRSSAPDAGFSPVKFATIADWR